MEKHKHEFSVEKMCQLMKVSMSGYFSWQNRAPSPRSVHTEQMTVHVKRAYQQSKKRYGSPKITMELNQQGIKISRPTVAKLMRKQELRSVVRRKFKVTTNSSHHYPVVENVLDRKFTSSQLNRAWVSDLTYIGTAQGWVYLTTVIDLFNRKVVGWSLSESMKTNETTVPAFRMAALNAGLKKDQRIIFHSDRGIQYACDEFVQEVNKYEYLERSMSRKGNCWDNAVAESFFKTLKAELVYQRKFESKEQAKLEVFSYIEGWYNHARRHQHLNNLTIDEFTKSINN